MDLLNRLPGGLIGKATETVRIQDQPFTFFGGKMYCFDTTPECRISIYSDHMRANRKGEKAMEVMTGSMDLFVKTKQWMLCRFGGLDDTPDIDENNRVQEAEYVPCEKRGSCPFEGIGCCTVEVSPGLFLSKAELAVTRLVRLGDKMIADTLFISTETVKTHIQNIRRKTKTESKLDLVHWATVKGII